MKNYFEMITSMIYLFQLNITIKIQYQEEEVVYFYI